MSVNGSYFVAGRYFYTQKCIFGIEFTVLASSELPFTTLNRYLAGSSVK
jgi:hypothetical protein